MRQLGADPPEAARAAPLDQLCPAGPSDSRHHTAGAGGPGPLQLQLGGGAASQPAVPALPWSQHAHTGGQQKRATPALCLPALGY